jgi:hypothetical protein
LAADLGTLVSHSDNGIRPQFSGMLQQEIVSLLARLLAHLGIGPNLAADDLLEPTQNALAYRWGSYDDSANETFVFCDAISLDRKRRRGLQRPLHPCSWMEWAVKWEERPLVA